jgi:hypothetical protein
LPREIESQVLGGSVGVGPASEYLAFRRMFQKLPSIDGIIHDPMGGVIDESPNVLFAIVTGLASKANPKTYPNIIIYGNRLMDEGHGEFAALLMNDCTKRDSSLLQTKDFIKMAAGPLGDLMSGSRLEDN